MQTQTTTLTALGLATHTHTTTRAEAHRAATQIAQDRAANRSAPQTLPFDAMGQSWTADLRSAGGLLDLDTADATLLSRSCVEGA